MRDPKVSNVPNESKLQRALMPNSRMFLLFLIVFAVLTFLFSDRLWLSIGEGVIILRIRRSSGPTRTFSISAAGTSRRSICASRT